MPVDKEKGGLSVILGLGPKPGEGDEDRQDPKRMAAEAMMDAIKEKDTDLFMTALDDYLGYRMEPEE